MRRSLMITIAATALVASGVPAASARAAASGSSWGTAEVVPGTAALNTQGKAQTSSVSCSSAGNCSMGGYYSTLINKHIATRPFVDSETNGTWHTAREVPGLSALHPVPTGAASISSVSCASAGNCGAGGSYTADNGLPLAFVVSQTGGAWGKAENVAGTPGNTNSSITSVSCTGPGDCTAGGYWSAVVGTSVQAFVLDETGGVWGPAEEVPGTATLNVGKVAQVSSVSCTSPGNCSAGGYYSRATRVQEAWVANETDGTWGNAEEVPGSAVLNQGGTAELDSLSCGAAGNCSAGGSYSTPSNTGGGFVVSETGSAWHAAKALPPITGSGPGPTQEVQQVSCGAVGNCGAGGYYRTSTGEQAFVVSEKNGTWAAPEEMPGIAALDGTGTASVFSASCRTAGNCSLGGYVQPNSGVDEQAFVITQSSGAWGTAETLPGSSATWSHVYSMSCASASRCVAGGDSEDSSGNIQAIVASST